MTVSGTNHFSGNIKNDGVITIDISKNMVNAGYVIDNFAIFNGGTYQIAISESQAAGNYKLAANASSFNGSITVKNTSDVMLGTLSVGSSFMSVDTIYSLERDSSGNLSLTLQGAKKSAAMRQESNVWSSEFPITGTSSNDVLSGNSNNNILVGCGGEDIFCFGENWGKDTVEQLAGGEITLWFESGSEDNWNADTLTYTDGTNSVKVSGISADNISLKFGDDNSLFYDELANSGCFDDAASEKIFEDKNKGMLA